MGPQDADLVQRWRRGEPAAFEVLVRRWQQPVARFLVRLVCRADLVADLCQEVFLRVYLARERYHETGAFAGWLYRIALNVARDAVRRQTTFQPLPEQAALEEADAEQVSEQQEVAEQLEDAIAELPLPLREVLVLRHYEGMSFEDIGRLLGVPASTLKSRFSAALTRLRQRLQQLGWSQEETPR
jgi:RNA polymerase sigma-70 factor (ECF subfamily)